MDSILRSYAIVLFYLHLSRIDIIVMICTIFDRELGKTEMSLLVFTIETICTI